MRRRSLLRFDKRYAFSRKYSWRANERKEVRHLPSIKEHWPETYLREDTGARLEQPGQIDEESRGEAGVVSVSE